LGAIPRVVGTISDKQSLLDLCAMDWPSCDIVEVRLDEVGGSIETWENQLKAIEGREIPIILTIRPGFEGGKWSGEEEARLPAFKRAMQSVSAVDIEYKSVLVEDICTEAQSLNKAVVVSFHDFEKTPNISELREILSKMSSFKGNVIAKISTMVNSEEDFQTLKTLLDDKQDIPVCIIGMGSKGTKTRTLFPALGSCMTYGYLDTSSAPGQLPCSLLIEQLRLIYPEFNEDIIIRHELLECA